MDRLDRKILVVLQGEGRISLTDLAARVGLSVSPCQRRVRELERSGIIAGYQAVLDRERVGLPVEVLVFVEMRQEDRETLLGFEAAVVEVSAVVQAQRLFGNPDYLLRLAVPSLGDYQEIEDDQLARLPGVQRLTSTIVMKQVLPSPRATRLTRRPWFASSTSVRLLGIVAASLTAKVEATELAAGRRPGGPLSRCLGN